MPLAASTIGPIAKPREVHVTPDLPKTLGKMIRRLLRDIVDGRPLGDTTSLQDPTPQGASPRRTGPFDRPWNSVTR